MASSTGGVKKIAVASDGVRRSKFSDGSLPSATWRSQEPGDHAVSYTELSFETQPDTQAGWATTTNPAYGLDLINDASVPYNPPYVGRSNIYSGTVGGGAPINIYPDGSIPFKVKEQYFCFHHRYSANFEDGNKLLFVYTYDDSDNTASTTTFMSPRLIGEMGGTAQYVRFGIQNEFTRMIAPNLTQTQIVLGQWHFFEVILRANSLGLADGEVHIWVDGEKNMEITDAQFRSDSHAFGCPLIQPTWAGSDTTAVNTFWHDYSSFYVSGKTQV